MATNVWSVAAGLAIGVASCRAQQAAPAQPPAVAPEIATADELLKALETADQDLKSLSGDLLWTKDFFLGGDTQTRKGKLFFVDERRQAKALNETADQKPANPVGRRKFAVRIEATVTQGVANGEGRLDQKLQEYVFDGVSLVERFPDEKRIVKHQLQAKENADPLRIGEGPIPLPVGQKREDILARFNVELLPAEKDLVPEELDKGDPVARRLTAYSQGCLQLKLVPKPEYEKECTFKQARLWYKRTGVGENGGSLLPRMARAVDKQDNTDTIMLSGVEVNGPVSAVFDASVPPGWDVQVMGGAAAPAIKPVGTPEPRDKRSEDRR